MIAAFQASEVANRYKEAIGEDVHDDFLFMRPIFEGPGGSCVQSSERGATHPRQPLCTGFHT